MTYLPLTPKRYGKETGVGGKTLLTPVYCFLVNSWFGAE